ncbi:hypothetical protein CU633_20645 [Bacillus sp. V3-13]|nr:hypothetical protein CU633_20645 [Bacillus sp. V3-13]
MVKFLIKKAIDRNVLRSSFIFKFAEKFCVFIFEDYLTPISSARQYHFDELLDNLDLSDFMYPLTLLIDSHLSGKKFFLFFLILLLEGEVKMRGKFLCYIIWKKVVIYVIFSNIKESA